jgi:hypothetical protein
MKSALLAFAIKVGVRLAIKLHKGPLHELAEKYRLEIALAQKQEGGTK